MTMLAKLFEKPIAKRVSAFTRTICDNRSGVAYIEFAYSLPVLIALGVTGVELANIALVHARISSITSMVADGAARVRDSIDEADINEIVLGAQMAGQGIKLTQHGRIVIYMVEDNVATPSPTNDQIITWKRCKGAKVLTAAQSFGNEGAVIGTQGIGPASKKISATPGNPVVMAHIIYDYQPIVTDKFFGPMTIEYTSAMIVRDRVTQTLNNGGNLSNANKSLCTAYSV